MPKFEDMKKKTLGRLQFEEEEEPYFLFGISTGFADYRLAWEINTCLDLKLLLSDEKLEIHDKRIQKILFYKVFHYFEEDTLTNYYLVKNKQQNQLLFPDKSKIDYFLLVREVGSFNDEECLQKIRLINGITAVFDFREEPFNIGPLLTF